MEALINSGELETKTVDMQPHFPRYLREEWSLRQDDHSLSLLYALIPFGFIFL